MTFLTGTTSVAREAAAATTLSTSASLLERGSGAAGIILPISPLTGGREIPLRNSRPLQHLHTLLQLIEYGYPAWRPNLPVLPFGSSTNASFIDPTVLIVQGKNTMIGQQVLVAPYATLNATNGYIKVGNGSSINDNATLVANPHRVPLSQSPGILIGDQVYISPGATIQGPASVGGYVAAAQPTYIGPNALVDGAIIQPGAFVGSLARVGPGVTVPSGFYVLQGANVTTNAEASNPALGKVRKVTSSDISGLKSLLSDSTALAAGYVTLYQGNKATGVSPGVPATVTNVNNGNLFNVEGVSPEPGVKFEPGAFTPIAPSLHLGLTPVVNGLVGPRIIGQVDFLVRLNVVLNHLGPRNSIRADQGQPIIFTSYPTTGPDVTITVPVNGDLTIGQNLVVGKGVVIQGGSLTSPGNRTAIGDSVTIGDGAVVNRSSIGTGSTIGPRAVVVDSTLPAHSVVPAGTIISQNKVIGQVQW